jgi:alpha-1,6-mannosyltransferase
MNQRTAASIALAFAAASLMSWQSVSVYQDSVPLFWVLALIMLLASFHAYRCANAIRNWHILSLAALLHAVALLGQPMFEDDYFRYLWDGYQSVENASPYRHAPEHYFSDPQVPMPMQSVLSGINNPEIPTIYGAAVQHVFALAYRISPGSERTLRGLFALMHLALIALLLRIGKHAETRSLSAAKTSRSPVLLYVLNPLVFKEVALTGHFDFLVPMGLIAATLCLQKSRALFAGICLSLAIASKIVAVLALPLLVWPLLYRAQYVKLGGLLLGCTVSLALLYWPFVSDFSAGLLPGDLAGLKAFSSEWRFNAGVFALIELVSEPLARVCTLLAVFALLGCFMLRAKASFASAPSALVAVFSALILLGPVVNPWYWLWVLPLTCLTSWRWPFWVSGALLLSYGHGLFSKGEHAYSLPLWLQVLEHGFIAVLILLACLSPLKNAGKVLKAVFKCE